MPIAGGRQGGLNVFGRLDQKLLEQFLLFRGEILQQLLFRALQVRVDRLQRAGGLGGQGQQAAAAVGFVHLGGHKAFLHQALHQAGDGHMALVEIFLQITQGGALAGAVH